MSGLSQILAKIEKQGLASLDKNDLKVWSRIKAFVLMTIPAIRWKGLAKECKCGCQICMVKTPNGKHNPVRLDREVTVVDVNGVVHKGVLTAMQVKIDDGKFIFGLPSHFADCKNAEEFRKEKKKGGAEVPSASAEEVQAIMASGMPPDSEAAKQVEEGTTPNPEGAFSTTEEEEKEEDDDTFSA